MVSVKTLLRELRLGNSVAEFDNDLEKYFVETEPFRGLINDKIDIIAGDKGTGKTALFKVLQKRYTTIPQFHDIEVLPAFNASGNPVFQHLIDKGVLPESEYIRLWKAYFLALTGNWLLSIYGVDHSSLTKELDVLLQGLGLRSVSETPAGIFQQIISIIGSFFQWKSAEVELSSTPDGKFTFRPRVEFEKSLPKTDVIQPVSIEGTLALLNRCLVEVGYKVWIVMDRLDEAFQGSPDVEIPALRALFRSYLDLLEFPNLKLKLFVRRDLFRRITEGGFVNLTHINARKMDVIWDEEDLLSLLCRRVRENREFCESLGIFDSGDRDIFYYIFPDQVDQGTRKPQTWVWMMRRIRDGNDIKPPRNLIDLVSMAQQAQLRREDRDPRDYESGKPVIEADSLRRALRQLSEQRVSDTLLAEAKSSAPLIAKFRGGKAEHNYESLATLLNEDPSNIRSAIKPLIEIGFLEEITGTFKVPSLYRDGLEITQGKAFDDRANEISTDDEQD